VPDKDRLSAKLAFQSDFRWNGVQPEEYKAGGGDWAGINRQVLVGDGAVTSFHLRYFEISPGGHSSLEKHQHAHVVICIRGHGQLIMGDECHGVSFLDTFYIAPWTPHQLVNTGKNPFGFFCIVDANRDKPQPLAMEDLIRMMQNPVVRGIVRPGNNNLSCDL